MCVAQRNITICINNADSYCYGKGHHVHATASPYIIISVGTAQVTYNQPSFNVYSAVGATKIRLIVQRLVFQIYPSACPALTWLQITVIWKRHNDNLSRLAALLLFHHMGVMTRIIYLCISTCQIMICAHKIIVFCTYPFQCCEIWKYFQMYARGLILI